MMPKSDMQCVWVGLAAIAVIYLMSQQNRHLYQQRPSRFDGLSGMVSRMNPFAGVSARIQRALASSDLIDASVVWPELKPGLISLIDNSKVSANATSEPTTDEEKEQNYKRLLEFIESKHNAKACIVVFAHWCPHCKTLIKELVDAANTKDGIKYLLVNGESVAPEAFTGPNAFVNLKHYPTILCKIGNKGKEVASLTEATETLVSVSEEDIVEEVATEGEVVAEEEVVEVPTGESAPIEDVLSQLF